jgi:pimeloyl-ACP methyl ester carboxylesterase
MTRVKRRWLRRLVRGLAAFVLVLVVAVAIAAIVVPDWTRAQLDATIVLAITQRIPVVAPLVRLATAAPRVDEVVIAGQPSTLVRPGGGRGPWPAIVFVNGATRPGRFHPEVQRLARGLARAGFLVAVPDLPGLRLGEITPATAAAATRVVLAVSKRADVRGESVSLYGVSVGATLALLAAEKPALVGRVRAVGGEAPWVDLEKVIRLATTGYYGPTPYATDPYVRLAIARSLAARLPRARDRARLLGRLEAVADDDPHPLGPLRSRLRLHAGGRALVSLLLNRDPSRFRALYVRLPPSLRRGVALLSPLLAARRLGVPVELASAPHDKYFPPAESRSLARRSPRVRVTVTSTLEHAVPRFALHDLADLASFDGFIVRFLRDARAR